MPTGYGFDVRVITPDGRPFEEYGSQRTGQRKIISTKIQAKDNQPFQIRVKTEQPFPFPKEHNARPNPFRRSIGNAGSSKNMYHFGSSGLQDPMDEESNKDEMDCGHGESPSVDYDFVAYVYIDGQPVEECTAVLCTDPKSCEYEPDGYILEGRFDSVGYTSKGPSRPVVVREWVFSSRSIDQLIAKLNIAAADPKIPNDDIDQELDEVTKALADDTLSNPTQRKRGQIEVDIARVHRVGMASQNSPWNRAEDLDGVGDDDLATHSVGLSSRIVRDFNAVEWKLKWHNPREQFFVKFVFQYMAIEKLVNLGLCTAEGKPTDHRGTDKSPSTFGTRPGCLKRVKSVDMDKMKDKMNPIMISSDEDEESPSEATSSSDSEGGQPRARLGARGKRPVRKRRAGAKGKRPRWEAEGDAKFGIEGHVEDEKILEWLRDLFRTESQKEEMQEIQGEEDDVDANGKITETGECTMELDLGPENAIEVYDEDLVEW